MRYPSLLAQRRGLLEVAMTPMVDVVFMLLIFFVWTASFRVAELSLPSSLITQEHGQGSVEVDPELEDLDRVVVRLGWSGTQPLWTINDVSVPSRRLPHDSPKGTDAGQPPGKMEVIAKKP